MNEDEKIISNSGENENRLNSFIEYCKNNQDTSFWSAIQKWAHEEYKNDFITGEKPEILNIYAGFDEEANENVVYWD